jgi:protoporphyrinogen oxidase
MYAARRSGQKRERFGYLPGGYARTLAAFHQRLLELGVEIRTGCKVADIAGNGRIEVTLTDGQSLSFDRVAVTTPAPVAAQICNQLSAEETSRLRGVEYLGIVCASLLLRKPLAGYYVTNITDPAPFTGVIEMSALVAPTEFGGRGLVYLPKYATADDPVWQRSDSEIQSDFVAALARLFPQFSTSDVLAFRLSRVRHVFALSTLGYSRRVPPIETSIPGLFLVNSSQIVNSTLNVNETVRLAESSLPTLCQALPQRTTPTERPRGLSHEDFCNDAVDGELVARP